MDEFYQTPFRLQSGPQDNITTERTLQQRGLDIVNFKDAKGTDDRDKLANALAYALDRSGLDNLTRARTVYLPSGTYDLKDGTGLPVISGNNIEIRGDGPATVLKISKTDLSPTSGEWHIDETYGCPFEITGTNIRVRDLTISYDVTAGKLIPGRATFDIHSAGTGPKCSDVAVENIMVNDMTALAVIGGNATPQVGIQPAIDGPSQVTIAKINGNYILNAGKDTVLVKAGVNLRFSDGRLNGGYAGMIPTVSDSAMIRFAPQRLIDTYSIVNWSSQARSSTGGPLQKNGFVIDCTYAACVNGTIGGTTVFDHVADVGVLITSKSVSDPQPDPEDVKFGGLVAVGLRSSVDTGVSRKVEWNGKGYFRGYVEIGSRLQSGPAADPLVKTALLVVSTGPGSGAFQPPLFESCTFRGIATSGETLPLVFDIAAPCSIVNGTIENSGAPRIGRLGRVKGSPVFRLTGCEVTDVLDPTIEYLSADVPPLPTVRNPRAVVTGNTGVFEDSVLDAAAAVGPYNVTTARWLRSGSTDPATISSSSRKAIYDKLVQALYDLKVIDRFGFLALLATNDKELSLHDLLVPTRSFVISGQPTFTPDKGWKGVTGPSTNVLDTRYYPVNDPKLTPDSVALLACCVGPSIQSSINNPDLGCGSNLRMSVRSSSDTITARLSTSTVLQSNTTSTSSVGTFLCNRLNTSVTFFDASGQRGLAVTDAAARAFPPNPLTLCGVGAASSQRIIRAAGVLKGFDPTVTAEKDKIIAMIAAFQTCFTAIDAL